MAEKQRKLFNSTLPHKTSEPPDLVAIERQINARASLLTKQYLEDIGCPTSQSSVFLVFKFLETPQQILVAGL